MTSTLATPIRTASSPEQAWADAWGLELTSQPQAFSRLPKEAYDALPGWNASLLKMALIETPAHAWAAYRDPKRTKKEDDGNKLIGNICHCRLLEPELFNSRYITLPPDAPKQPTEKQLEPPEPGRNGAVNTSTKAYAAWLEAKSREEWWKQFKAENEGRQIVGEKDLALGDALANAVLNHPVLAPRFADTPVNRAGNELTLTWIDSLTSARCKGRLDAVRFLGDRLWIGDLKTAADAGPGEEHFGRAADSFKYILSAAWYVDGAYFCRAAIEEILGLPEGALILAIREFEFVAIEKAHPRPEFVGRYLLTEEQADMGRRMARRALEMCVQAEASGWWHGYDVAAKPLQLPAYAWTRMERLLEGGE